MPGDTGAALLLIPAAVAVLAGGVLQRVSGMGMGLVVSPTLVLLVGPVSGVLLTNVTTTVSAALIGIAVRRDVDWRRYGAIAPLILVGSVLGALLVRAADRAWLEIVIGVVLLLALGAAGLARHLRTGRTRLSGAGAGIVGGFLNTAVGVAAPALLIYAQATGWAQRSFAATLQPIFFTMGAVSIITKVGLGATDGVGPPSWWLILTVVVTVPIGTLLGARVATRLSAATGRRIAVVIVVLGALGTLVRGLVSVSGGTA